MKKLVLIFLLIAVSLCACMKEESAPISESLPEKEPISEKSDPAYEIDIKMRAEAVTEKYCTLVIETDYAEGEITCGQNFYIKKDGERLAAIIPEEEISWIAIAYIIEPGTPCQIEQSWEYMYGDLPAGTYEIVKTVHAELPNGERGSIEVSAEFELAYVD